MNRSASFTYCSNADCLQPRSVAAISKRLNVTEEAVQLCHRCGVIDLHLDPFIAHRLWGYDVLQHHNHGPFGTWLFGHTDLVRGREGGLSGGMFSITTNPFRFEANRWKTLQNNIARMKSILEHSSGRLRLVKTAGDYDLARKAGSIACLLAIQGGHALLGAPDGVDSLCDGCITRVTLVHLTSSQCGCTSSPASIFCVDRGLKPRGIKLIEYLNNARCLVDLAHIHPTGFWQALQHHRCDLPAIVTHTGASGVTAHWRNLTDAQIQAIAHTGGTIGVLFHVAFLDSFTRAYIRRSVTARHVLAHIKHIVDVAGDDFVSIGSDFDGFIVPPKDLADVSTYPRLVQLMLEERWSHERIEKILSGNFLRVFKMIRP